MNDLIAKYFLGELTSDQKKALFERMAADPEAKKEFAEMQNSWALASSSASAGDRNEAQPHFRNFMKRRRQKTTRTFVISFAKYAAVLLIGMLIAGSITLFRLPSGKVDTAYHQLSVPAGQRAMLTLDDGTVVWVDAKSTLSYPGTFAGNTREVTLTGEAYFEVASDPDNPFIVKTGNFRTMAVGTQFNVFAYDGFYEVSLVEGQVKVYEADRIDNAVTLAPREKAIRTDGQFVKTTMSDFENFLWKEGIYSFDDVPFPEIIEKLQLYYDVRIIVENKTLLTRKYTGKFRQRDGIDNVLSVIRKVYPFSYQKDDIQNVIIIK